MLEDETSNLDPHYLQDWVETFVYDHLHYTYKENIEGKKGKAAEVSAEARFLVRPEIKIQLQPVEWLKFKINLDIQVTLEILWPGDSRYSRYF